MCLSLCPFYSMKDSLSEIPQAYHSIFKGNPPLDRQTEVVIGGWRRAPPFPSEMSTCWSTACWELGSSLQWLVSSQKPPNKLYQDSKPDDSLEAHYLQLQPHFEEIPLFWFLTELFHLSVSLCSYSSFQFPRAGSLSFTLKDQIEECYHSPRV